ncbi:MAG: MoxR family ATPase [Actinoplanes sp.]
MTDWLVYRGVDDPHDGIAELPAPPNWRTFDGGPALPVPPGSSDTAVARRLGHGSATLTRPAVLQMINAALYLRRPLLVTGKPGVGKSALAYAVARELRLGPVLTWPISSRSTLAEGLYQYDPIGRLREENLRRLQAPAETDESSIGRYLTLGPLGTALLPYEKPRVLLIDEIDKSDIDLPNDLLNVFEEGEYTIPELRRIAAPAPEVDVLTADDGVTAPIRNGRVRCRAFPFVVLTSNAEREFPPAFLRRCLRLVLAEPEPDQIGAMIESHLGPAVAGKARDMVKDFVAARGAPGVYATDQILSAVYLRFARHDVESDTAMLETVRAVLSDLSGPGPGVA